MRKYTKLIAVPGGIQLCRDAVEATDQSSATTAYERRAVRGWLADAYMLAKQWSEAIATYQSALAIDTTSDADEVNAGELLTKMAIAYTNVGDLAAADRSAASAVAKVEASMAAHPDQRKSRRPQADAGSNRAPSAFGSSVDSSKPAINRHFKSRHF